MHLKTKKKLVQYFCRFWEVLYSEVRCKKFEIRIFGFDLKQEEFKFLFLICLSIVVF